MMAVAAVDVGVAKNLQYGNVDHLHWEEDDESLGEIYPTAADLDGVDEKIALDSNFDRIAVVGGCLDSTWLDPPSILAVADSLAELVVAVDSLADYFAAASVPTNPPSASPPPSDPQTYSSPTAIPHPS